MSIHDKNRDEFLSGYLKDKQAVFSRLEREVFDKVRLKRETISCHKGCSLCCSVYIEATLKECIAIAYHLCNNDILLNSFLNKYPDWLRKTQQFRERCRKAISEARKQNQSRTTFRELVDSLLFYKLQNIPCPFLNEGFCSIYAARPFTCASHFVTSPAEWCSPRNTRNPIVYKGNFANEVSDSSFNGVQLENPGITLMPLKVYEILQSERDLPNRGN